MKVDNILMAPIPPTVDDFVARVTAVFGPNWTITWRIACG